MLQKIEFFFQQHELPGNIAHIKMSPFRKIVTNIPEKARKSSVLLMLHEFNNDIYCTLTERSEKLGTHSNQIAFPGGKIEQNESEVEACLRETHEEIGIDRNSIKIIGQLTSIYIPPSNFLVYPFIGITNQKPTYKLNTYEVKEVFDFNIYKLLNENIVKEKKIKTANGMLVQAPYFEIKNKVVWGATAAILNEFKEILQKI